MSILNRIVLSLFLIVSFPLCAHGADLYINKNCASNGDGTSWACVEAGQPGAFNDMPADYVCAFNGYAWVRGITYWVAGSDSAYRASCARLTSGSGTLTIKKATASAHGTETGWDASYGTKQAIIGGFTAHSTYDVTNVLIDGVGRTNETSGYGFKLVGETSGANTFGLRGDDNFTARYIEITSSSTPIEDNCTNLDSCLKWGVYFTTGTGILLEYLYIHDVAVPFGAGATTNFTIDNCRIERNDSYTGAGTDNHSEGISITGGTNINIKNNKWIDIEGTATFAMMNQGIVEGANIYNNLIYCTGTAQCGHGNGVLTCTNAGTECNDVNFYNNTLHIYGSTKNKAAIDIGTGGVVRDWNVKNNLWWCTGDVCANAANEVSDNITYDTNWYGGVIFTVAENGAIIGGTENPFNNYSIGDYSLNTSSTPIGEGTDLSTFFTTDILGVTRPKGSAWDIGAYEYNPSTALKQSLSNGSLGGGAMR